MDSISRSVARRVFVAFVATFLFVRILVLLVITRRIPDLFIYVGGTHVHHLNYGIFLLAGVAAYLLFARPQGRWVRNVAVVYGAGLALTFDEFAMWFHLGGNYWAEASFEAVVVIGGLLALAAFAPTLRRFRPHHWVTVLLLAAGLVLFGWLLWNSFGYTSEIVLPKLQGIEEHFER